MSRVIKQDDTTALLIAVSQGSQVANAIIEQAFRDANRACVADPAFLRPFIRVKCPAHAKIGGLTKRLGKS